MYITCIKVVQQYHYLVIWLSNVPVCEHDLIPRARKELALLVIVRDSDKCIRTCEDIPIYKVTKVYIIYSIICVT